MHTLKSSLLSALVIILCSCEQSETNKNLAETDPFKNSIVESQVFDVVLEGNTVVEGNSGTVVVIPENSFLDSEGNAISGNIQLELAEALDLESMLLSNLTTTSDGLLLETGGMIYLNAFQDGKELQINPDKPLYIEIPTENKKPGMSVYEGLRDAAGNMNWVNPIKLKEYLIKVELEELNFLPDGFALEVEKGLPFRSHDQANKSLLDSLFYSLSVSDGTHLTKGLQWTDYNEPAYSVNREIVNGKYSDGSYRVYSEEAQMEVTVSYDSTAVETESCGIDPSSIKTIQTAPFQNTFIATREFEKRLQDVYASCNETVLEVYLQNLDKDLYISDSIAAGLVTPELKAQFENYAAERKTNIKDAPAFAEALSDYYSSKRAEIKDELIKAQQELEQKLQEKNEDFKKVVYRYKKLLWKREKYRMERYGFEWSRSGWINVDKRIIQRTDPVKLEVEVSGEEGLEQLYTYVVFNNIASISRLNTIDHKVFYAGNNQTRSMTMELNVNATIVTIGYDGEDRFLGIQQMITGQDTYVKNRIQKVSESELKTVLKKIKTRKKENQIERDLKYMQQFYEEKQRQKQLKKEEDFINSLHRFVFKCCPQTETVDSIYSTEF